MRYRGNWFSDRMKSNTIVWRKNSDEKMIFGLTEKDKWSHREDICIWIEV